MVLLRAGYWSGRPPGEALRVWRTDEATALSPHPSDPGLAGR